MKVKLIKSLSILLALGVVAFTTGSSTFAAGKLSSNIPVVDEQAKFILGKPTDLETLRSHFNKSDLSITVISNIENINGTDYTGFYSIPYNKNFDEICNDFTYEYSQELDELINKFKNQALQETNQTRKKSVEVLLKDTLQRKENISKGIKPKIGYINVKGTKNALENEFNKNKDLFKDIKYKVDKNNTQLNKSKDINTNVTSVPILSAVASQLPWLPNRGGVSTSVTSWDSAKVYMYNSFWWDSDAALAGLRADNNKTFEGDIVFYNYDGTAFAKDWGFEDPNNSDKGLYWDTNQPRAYWDTQASDSSNERVFCVGCSDATKLTSSNLYYWSGTAKKNSSGSKAKLVMQRGHRNPSNFYDNTWGVFLDENSVVVPFSTYSAPGYYYWSR